MADTFAVSVISPAEIDIGGYANVYRVSSDACISDLVNVIAKDLSIHRSKLGLWTPKEPVPIVNAASYLSDRLSKAYGNLEAIATSVVDPMQSVKDLLPFNQGGQGRVDSGQLHFILEIRHPKRRREEEDDDSGNYLLSRYKRTIIVDRESPSSNSRPSNYIKNQAGDTAILDGRYDPTNSTPTAAPPIQLYHPVFADFLGAMGDTSDLPEDLVVQTGELMRNASGIAILESSRSLPSSTHISTILGVSLLQSVNLNKASADHTIFHIRTSPIQTALLATVEEKSELGYGGDVTTQGGCSYTDFWLSKDHQELRECSCCPSFIICLAGPWLVVMGAVFTTQPIVQRLTDFIWLGTSPVINDAQCIRVAGVLRALKAGVRILNDYYRDLVHLPLSSNAHHPRFFPFPTSFLNDNQPRVHFKYLKPLKPLDPGCVTFLAETIPDKSKVVVKFVQTYGVEAHRLLAQHNLAPPLLHFKHLSEDGAGYGALKMVVMGYVEGKTVTKVFNGAALSPNVVGDLECALSILHGEGLVFGDLRRPNIMIMPGPNEDDTVRLIDFDWAGKENEVRYPIHLNQSKEVKWADGVGSYRKIDKTHDLDMLVILK
ncbi:uncharacterized protein EV420DRAFT_1523465 [Desarmillaria tabescens]|uniref:Protein kinase domain-containing protein n=1 Tax=Armillaria tabescens TaxID=1929756 RepID=A0AA39TQS0_ARMTA|nr:uncharacterized protein EV420DRAFT_1523465 [Desarmillaria tabescens]KAK0463243.1 hypothetical protein EV420DRAFT_1523465 [Desarmillaria tabescens]